VTEIKRTAKAMSVKDWDSLKAPSAMVEYMIESLLREMPDADTLIFMVEKRVND
jgi:hypothetical protein